MARCSKFFTETNLFICQKVVLFHEFNNSIVNDGIEQFAKDTGYCYTSIIRGVKWVIYLNRDLIKPLHHTVGYLPEAKVRLNS